MRVPDALPQSFAVICSNVLIPGYQIAMLNADMLNMKGVIKVVKK